jgi:hypothetical protein
MNDDCEQEGSSHIWVKTGYSKKMSTHQQRWTSFLIYNTLYYAPYAEAAKRYHFLFQ